METKELLGWTIIFLLCLPLLWVLWQFLKFAARGMARFKHPAISSAAKYTSAFLMVSGAAMIVPGAALLIDWRTGGMHLAALGAGWLAGGIWLMATRPTERIFMSAPIARRARLMQRAAIVEFFIGTAIAAAGVVHALTHPPTPVVGTGTVADLLSAGGFAVLFAGLWSIAPGGAGVPGGGDGGGGFGGGDGGGGGG